MNAVARTDTALAAAQATLDACSAMLAEALAQAARRDAHGYSHAQHDRGHVQLHSGSDTAYLTIVGPGYNVGVHDWTATSLRSLAAACIAVADQMEARS